MSIESIGNAISPRCAFFIPNIFSYCEVFTMLQLSEFPHAWLRGTKESIIEAIVARIINTNIIVYFVLFFMFFIEEGVLKGFWRKEFQAISY